MSKNIRGLTQAIVNVSQINFIDALFNTVTATTVNGTDGEFTGTLKTNNLTINGQFSFTGSIDVDGVTTSTLKITALPQDNDDNNDRPLLFVGQGDEVYKNTSLHFNPSTSLLTITGLTSTGDTTLNKLNVSGTVELASVPNINVDSYTSILLHGDNNEINQDISFSYNSSLNLLQAININSNGTITANTISCDNLTASAGLSAQTLAISGNSVLNTATFTGKIELDLVPNINVDSYTSILLHGDNNEINQDISFSYNSSLNLLQSININANGYVTTTTLSCDNLTISNAPTNDTDTALRKIPFIGSNGLLHASSNLYYVPDPQTLVSTNIEATSMGCTDIVIGGELILTSPAVGFADVNYNVSFYGYGNTLSQSNAIHFNPFTETLKCPNIIANLTGTSTGTHNGPVTLTTGKIFNDASNNYMGLKATTLSGFDYNLAIWNDGHVRMNASTQIRFYVYNTSSETSVEQMTLTSNNLRVANNIIAEANLTCSGSVTIVNPLTSGVNRPCSLTFIDDAGDNRLKIKSSINYNPSTETLTVPTIVSSELTVNGDATITGTLSAGTFNVNTQNTTNFSVSGNLTLPNLSTPVFPKDYALLLKQTDTDEVFETDTAKINVGVSFGSVFLRAEQLRANTVTLNELPLHYTETYTTQGFTTTFGLSNFVVVGIDNQLKQFGDVLLNPSGGIFNFKNSSQTWGFTDSSFDGLYDVHISGIYQNRLSQRVTPRLSVYRYRNQILTEQLQLHPQASYTRNSIAKCSSVGISGKMFLQANDTFKIATLLNIHTTTDFSDSTSLYTLTDVAISMTYLGKLTETVFN